MSVRICKLVVIFWAAASLAGAQTAPFVLLRPAARAQLTIRTPDFDWSNSAGSLYYDWQLATDPAFSQLLGDCRLDSSRLIWTTPLRQGDYYWRVRACTDSFTGAWSTIQSFTILFPPPLPLFPFQNSQLTDRRPRFDWSDAPGAVGYQFQLAADDSLNAPLREVETAASSWQSDQELPYGVWFWHVRAISALDTSLWSTLCKLTLPAPPQLLWLRINNGDSSTSDGKVRLNNAVQNEAASYIASEHADFSAAFWLPYASAPEFVLSAGAGLKTIYFKTRNLAGESGIVSDTIERTAASAVRETAWASPSTCHLLPLYPNPFNTTTRIDIERPEMQAVELRVVNSRGRVVRCWRVPAGGSRISMVWDGRDQAGNSLASGWFAFQLVCAGRVEESRVALLLK
jgi:hypothetical protein